jgi:uncharacterized protein (DUF924 family)
MTPIEPRDVLDFWMAAGEDKWFEKSDDFDDEIRARFGDHLEAAKQGAYDAWAETTQGKLALIIMLDQFSRNLHRGSAKAFEADAKALALAKGMIADKADMELPEDLRRWVYLPYEHSEDLGDQETCVKLMERTGSEESVKYAVIHLDIIKEFGRFPHRNPALGRTSTPEELKFLEDGGFAG